MTARGLRIVTDTARDTGPAAAEPAGAAVRAAAVTGPPMVTSAVTRPSAVAQPSTATRISTVTVPAGAAGLLPLAPRAEERRWTVQALCASGDPDRLFVTGAAQREAAKLCRNCPVQMQCLADALDNQVEFGVWGGLTERQRRAVLKRRPGVASWRAVLEQARADSRRGVAS